jgi:hypothetical protein
MPYLTAETGAYPEARKNRLEDENCTNFFSYGFDLMWKIANDYGPQGRGIQHKDTMHIPLTLDQSYFKGVQSTADDDTDQVIYRYTKGKEELKSKNANNQIPPEQSKSNIKLLMVNQIWLWKVDGN